ACDRVSDISCGRLRRGQRADRRQVALRQAAATDGARAKTGGPTQHGWPGSPDSDRRSEKNARLPALPIDLHGILGVASAWKAAANRVDHRTDGSFRHGLSA